jgi:hypothetical protein
MLLAKAGEGARSIWSAAAAMTQPVTGFGYACGV